MSTVVHGAIPRTHDAFRDRDPRVPFPGIPTTSDGAGTVTWVETNITQGACAYPITSSTTMGGGYETEVANGKRNLWGEELAFVQPESEHSAATTCEGFAVAGGRVTNFTSGQGLILMKEVLYTISGKRLPIVFHIGARALTSHSLNVHAGHDDVVGVADCGWGIVYARNAQEAGDLALIARRTAEDTETPFLNVQDGFLTTHTIENVRLPELDLMKMFVGPPSRLRNLMDPQVPLMSGVVQNQDSYMKGKIAQRRYYDRVLPALKTAMEEFGELTGRRYAPLMPYRMEDAEYAIVGSGCMMETAEAAVDWIRERRGVKVGLLHITCFRPFPSEDIVLALRHVKAMSVIERLDIPMMQSNPQLCEIKAAFADAMAETPGYPPVTHIPQFCGGSAGLGSRDVRAGDFIAMVDNMLSPKPRTYFTVGIKHETALPVPVDPDVRGAGSFSMRGHSVGGYGSVTTNKVIATIAGEVFGMDVQAYPKYGSEKKGLPTTYYLTIAKEHIRVHFRARACGVHSAERRECLQHGRPADRAGGPRHGFRAEPEDRSGRSLELGSGLGAQGDAGEKRAAFCARYGGDCARGIFARGLAAAHAGHRAAGNIPAHYSLSSRVGDLRGAIAEGRREVAAQVLRQARRAGGAGQPQSSPARL
jgi:Pyruvate:ferredoxin oxidoreductase and related 2-oxoacid:ferredoxin oxidoreductases, alpha subunit